MRSSSSRFLHRNPAAFLAHAASFFAMPLAFTLSAHAACPFALNGASMPIATTDAVAFTRFAQREAQTSLRVDERSVHEHVAKHLTQLDLNADGRYDLTDALIATRSMLGFVNGGLSQGLSLTGARATSQALQTFIDSGCTADASTSSTWQAASFSESSAVLTNPERGFWVFLTNNFATVQDSNIAWIQQTYPDVAIGYAVVRLDSYRNQSLPQSLIDSVTASFTKVRAHGMKVILRFAYNYPEGEAIPVVDDAPLSRVLEHIQQIAPLVRANSDVIFVWQAGFIGVWGEGHTSTNGLDSAANKATIRDALLDVLPENRFLMWRYPPDQIAWDAEAGGETDAFGTTRKARVGMYNDCFMSSDTDVGTYDDNASIRAQQRAYVAARSAIVPFGGETCNGPVAAQQRRTCAAILSEAPEFHMSYLNRTYYDAFHTQWQTEGCFSEINNKLGYRWVMNRIDAPRNVARGAIASMALNVKNVGWARLYNARKLQVQLVSRANPAAAPISAHAAWDPRQLKPNETSSVLFHVDVPDDALIGTYDVFMAAPDLSTSITSNSAYAIRFANSDNAAFSQSWNATRGAFATGIAINVF
jgi:hypothetical protein